MSALADVVSVSITSVTSNPTQPGFGTPLILDNTSATAAWADVVREYTDLTAVSVDFATTTATYKAASKLFSQSPRPERVLVAKGTLKPTQRWTITPTPFNNYTYKLVVNGQTVTYTSDATALATEITAGLKTAIDALGLAVTTTAGATLTIVANSAGAWFSVGNPDLSALALVMDATDPGIATDLAAVNLVRSDWYGLLTLFNSQAMVVAAAAWAQANGKLYLAQTQDSAVMTAAAPGSDVAAAIKTGNYDNVSVWYSGDNSDFLDAGLFGARAPYTPGEESWKFVNVVGVPVGSYTATQRTNCLAKNANFFEPTQGVPMTAEGTSGSGKYIDLVRYLNYLQSRVGTRVFGRLAAFPKVPYTDEGIAIVQAEVQGQLQEDEKRGAIASGWVVSVPKVANVSAGDKASRILRNVVFSATYSGAIHKVLISGSVSV